MIVPRLLTEAEFDACWALPMKDVTGSVENAINIWPYVDAIDPVSICVKTILDVTYVYRDAQARYDHVIVETDQENVVLVIVVDIDKAAVFGHHFLDLNIKYGLSTQH